MLRELKIMRLMQHENILSIYDIMRPESVKKMKDIYILTELMQTDLYTLLLQIQKKERAPLTEE